MGIIPDAMERLAALMAEAAEKATAAAIAVAPPPASTVPSTPVTPEPTEFNLRFLDKNGDTIPYQLSFSTTAPIKNEKGHLSKEFKAACATTFQRYIRGGKPERLKDAVLCSIADNTEGHKIKVQLSRLIRWTGETTTTTQHSILKIQLTHVFGATPPWNPGQTWEDALKTTRPKSAPTPGGQ